MSSRRWPPSRACASLTASFSVRLPLCTGSHLGAEQPHAEHVERLALHVDLAHVDLALHARAARRRWRVATPCWPAPVSATSRVLPMRLASSAWPSTLLILCEPVWLRSSRLSSSRTPSCSAEVVALGEQRRPAGVVAQQRRRARRGTPGRPTRRGTPPRAPGTPGTSVSGTNRPPNSPKRPVGVGLAHHDVLVVVTGRSLVGPVVGQLVGPEVRHGRGRPGRAR